jgi:hypothetical protein
MPWVEAPQLSSISLHNAPDQRIAKWENKMEVADLVLPVFAIIVTGWLAGWLGYISQSLADGLVHFAYNIAMPALLFVTIAGAGT